MDTLRSYLLGAKSLNILAHTQSQDLTQGETSNADNQSCHCPIPVLFTPFGTQSISSHTPLSTRYKKTTLSRGALPLPLLTHAPPLTPTEQKKQALSGRLPQKKKEETKRTARKNNNSVCSKTSQTRRRTKTNPLMQEMPWSDCDRSQKGWEFEKKKKRKLCQDAKKTPIAL